MEKLQDKRISLRISNQLLQGIYRVKGNNKSDKIKRILESGLANQAIDNCDYSGLINALFKLRIEIAPIGSNLNQLVFYLNRGNDFNNMDNIEALNQLQKQFKEWMKINKILERKLKLK